MGWRLQMVSFSIHRNFIDPFLWYHDSSGINSKTTLIPKSDFTDYLGYMLAGFGTIIATKSSKKYAVKQFLGFEPTTKR